MPTFVRSTRVRAQRSQLFEWHARPGAFERLTPPWESVRLVEDSGGIGDGARKVLAIGPFGLRWIARHEGFVAGRRFRDVQERGPFRRWVHTHTFQDDGPAASVLEDRIEYELPLGRVGAFFGDALVRRKLERMFEHRHRVTRHDVELAAREPAADASLTVAGSDRSARAVWAFLSTVGWRARRGEERDAGSGAAVRVEAGSVRIEHDGETSTLPLADLSDAGLARLHRALRAVFAAG